MKFRILVVEDNPADVDLLRRALADAAVECDLTVVDDGADALKLVRNPSAELPELAIIDLNLPKHGGLEVLAAIRSNASLANVLILVLSSSSSPRERECIAKAGVERHIVKPPDLDEFMRIGHEVKALLAQSKTRSQSAGADH